ncbi:MAG: hypothetical protein JJV97_02650 [SAR324 cluster bacterium]|nr:hypothetical protein [SAR324 cluster bacterium]
MISSLPSVKITFFLLTLLSVSMGCSRHERMSTPTYFDANIERNLEQSSAQNYQANCLIKIKSDSITQKFRCTLALNDNSFQIKIFAAFKGLVWAAYLNDEELRIYDYQIKKIVTHPSNQIAKDYLFPLNLTSIRAILLGLPSLADNQMEISWQNDWPSIWSDTQGELVFHLEKWIKNNEFYYPHEISMENAKNASWQLAIVKLTIPDALLIKPIGGDKR